MDGKSALILVASIVMVFGSLAPAAQEKTASKITKDQCLACHGPYEKIAETTADFVAPSGEKVTPHQYVAHDTKDIPECTECHTPHAIPLEDKATVTKPAGVDWCYMSCHHAQNLQACNTCH